MHLNSRQVSPRHLENTAFRYELKAMLVRADEISNETRQRCMHANKPYRGLPDWQDVDLAWRATTMKHIASCRAQLHMADDAYFKLCDELRTEIARELDSVT